MGKAKLKLYTRRGLKVKAKMQLGAQYRVCVGVGFVSMLIPTVLTLINGSFGRMVFMLIDYQAAIENTFQPSMLYNVLSRMALFLSAIIAIEVGYFYLRVFRGEGVHMYGFLAGLLADVGRKVGALLWQYLWLFMWCLAPILLYAINYFIVQSAVL